jgi:hypothetical protein
MSPRTSTTSKRDAWPVQMAVYLVHLAIHAPNAGLNTTTIPSKAFVMKFVVMANVFH